MLLDYIFEELCIPPEILDIVLMEFQGHALGAVPVVHPAVDVTDVLLGGCGIEERPDDVWQWDALGSSGDVPLSHIAV